MICFLTLTTGADKTCANITVAASVTNVSGPVQYTSGIVYNGSIIATATGGTAPYTYSIDPAVVLNNGYFPELPAGTYTVVATDATGQQASTTVTILFLHPQPSVSISDIIQPSGCSSVDGGFTLTGTGGTPPYTYSIDGGNSFGSNNVFTNLTQGTYEVLIMDADGQVAQLGSNPTSPYRGGLFVFLSAPDCTQYGIPEFTASCVNNGSVAITLQSYTPADSFSLDGIHYRQIPASDILDIYEYDSTGLAPGLYNFYEKIGTAIDIYAGISEKFCYVNITFISIDASCGGSDGGFQVMASNGYPPYSYTIDGINYQASNTFTGLSSGNYDVTVKDVEGGTYSATAVVYNKCPMVTATATNDICGQNNGTITASGAKGTLPYQFSIDGTNFQSGSLFTGLPAGNYTVTIRDALGFKSTSTATVVAYCLSVSAIPSNAECGNANGTIAATGAGGEAPYAYSIDGINFQPSNLFAGLPAGNYVLTVKDATGYTVGTPITITNIAGPTMTVTSQPAGCDSTGGSLSIQALGGTAPYQYSADGINFQSGNSFNLVPGSYTAWLKDALGCTATLPFTITVVNNISLYLAIDALPICQGGSIPLTGSSNAFEFSWSPTAGVSNPAVLLPTISPTQTTTYTLTATWGACQTQSSWTITVNPAPVPNAGQDTTICYGQSLQLNGSGGMTYTWSPAIGLSNSNIPSPTVDNPGQTVTYQLSVTDQLGCTSLQPSTITVYVTPPAKLSAGDDTSVLINEPIQLSAIDIDNSGFTSYTWTPATGLNNPDISNPIATLGASTTYSITGQTAAGCEGTASLTIKVYTMIDLIVPNAFTPNGDGHNDILKVIPLGIRQLQYFAAFNRWGKRIFYTANAANGWDGTLNGQLQPAGTYVWMAGAIDLHGHAIERKGTVVLIR